MATTKVKYPIWLDKSFTVPTNLAYAVYKGNDIIYTGMPKGNDNTTNIYLRDILKNYLSPMLVASDDGYLIKNRDQCGNFSISVYGEQEPRYEILTWWDWSYDNDFYNLVNRTDGILSQVVNTHWHPDQIIPITFYNGTNIHDYYYNRWEKDGTVQSDELNTYDTTYPVSTLTISPVSYINFGIKIDNSLAISWPEKDKRPCASGSLYYINQFGGWDSFLLEYNIVESVDVEKQNYQTGADYLSENFDNSYVIKSLRNSYKTNTGWLTEGQSYKIYHNLLTSPMIYFQNFNGNDPQRLIPINFTKTNFEKKEFKNTHHLVNYELEFKEANIRLRD